MSSVIRLSFKSLVYACARTKNDTSRYDGKQKTGQEPREKEIKLKSVHDDDDDDDRAGINAINLFFIATDGSINNKDIFMPHLRILLYLTYLYQF